MATPTLPETTDDEAPPPAVAVRPRGNFKVLVLIAALMVGEGIVGYLLLPEPRGSPAGGAGGAGGQAGNRAGDEVPDAPSAPAADVAEYEIGPIQTTNQVAAAGISYNIRCTVHVLVERDSLQQFDGVLADRRQRVTEIAAEVVRGASLEDLNDPHLALVKRQIRDRVNELLGRSYIADLVITEFSMFEQ